MTRRAGIDAGRVGKLMQVVAFAVCSFGDATEWRQAVGVLDAEVRPSVNLDRVS